MTKNTLKQAGYKSTKPRQQVLKILQVGHTPLSAKTIYKKTRNINLASIYRTLKLLTELNIIQQEFINNKNYYYLANKKHHHIICKNCGHLECIPCNHSFKIKNFSQINHQVMLTGLCNKCAVHN